MDKSKPTSDAAVPQRHSHPTKDIKRNTPQGNICCVNSSLA